MLKAVRAARPASRVAFVGLVLAYSSCLALGKDAENGDDESHGARLCAKPLSRPQDQLRQLSRRLALDRFRQFWGVQRAAGAFDACEPRERRQSPDASGTSGVSSPSSRSVGVDVPLTIDLNDRVSVYGGFSASASRTDLSDWSAFTINSWSVGFQADVHQQNGGSIPTITLQSTLTLPVPNAVLPTTSLNTILEFDHALNADETKGFLAGVQYTGVAVDSTFVRINPNIVGYVGGYYQWDNNWKFSGRVGVQSFGGAQLLNRTPFEPFTQPIVRLDLDRMDDDDNRLFGITAQIAWVPKPSYQITVRTPLYLGQELVGSAGEQKEFDTTRLGKNSAFLRFHVRFCL